MPFVKVSKFKISRKGTRNFSAPPMVTVSISGNVSVLRFNVSATEMLPKEKRVDIFAEVESHKVGFRFVSDGEYAIMKREVNPYAQLSATHVIRLLGLKNKQHASFAYEESSDMWIADFSDEGRKECNGTT